jgi:PhnB protein
MVKPIPEGYHSVTPYLVVDDAKAAIDFYTRAFGAREKFRMPMGDRIGHAEIIIGDSVVMLADEFPEQGHLGPKSRGGPTASLMLYVQDVDSAFRQALDAGATEQRPVENQFWGDRMGTLVDPFGHMWSLATTVEEVSPEEMQRRLQQMSGGQKQAETV